MKKLPPYVLSIAPMMDYTDRHFRTFMRLLTKNTWLYTEMVSTGAILHGDTNLHLQASQNESPLVLQLGGSEQGPLQECVKIASTYLYDEINLNAGCPSDRVQHHSFGASLMADTNKTAKLIQAMVKTSQSLHKPIPITIKCRIGIDGKKINLPTLTDYEHLYTFVKTMLDAGASRVIIHARIAILGGLSPKENRNIPPLQYDVIQKLSAQIKKIDPHVFIEVNGGIKTLNEAKTHLQYADAIMIGRAAVDNPYIFSDADAWIQNPNINLSNYTSHNALMHRQTIAKNYASYLEKSILQLDTQDPQYPKHKFAHIRALGHLMHLYAHISGARKWRQVLTEHINKKTNPITAVEDALQNF